ncbi:MAG: UPF0158 family protein [Bacteroidota bacterium]
MNALSDEIINEISEKLQMGYKCYYNPINEEIHVLEDLRTQNYLEKDYWTEGIEYEFHKYIVFEAMPNFEFYKLMQEFAENTENKKLKKHLVIALNQKQPFRNFFFQVDNSGEYRKKWFKFKSEKYAEWVRRQFAEWIRKKK